MLHSGTPLYDHPVNAGSHLVMRTKCTEHIESLVISLFYLINLNTLPFPSNFHGPVAVISTVATVQHICC